MVIICYYHADFATEPAVKFLQGRAAQRGWPPRPTAEVARMVEDVFAEAFDADPGDFLVPLCDTGGPLDDGAMRLALKYVSEWRVGA